MKQKQSIKKHIININKTHNFPELTEETLQAYCTDPDSFIKKVRDHQQLIAKNKKLTNPRQTEEELSPTHNAVAVNSNAVSTTSNNNVAFFEKLAKNPPSQNDKVKASCACFKQGNYS